MSATTHTAKGTEARYQQAWRLISVLETAPDLKNHIELQFKNGTPEDAKRRGIRALMVRARVRAGDALRYVIVQETAENGRDIIAYHVFSNLDTESCRDVCARWDIGPYIVSEVNAHRWETLPPFIFDTSRPYYGRRLFNASRNIWAGPPARPAPDIA